MEVGQFKGMGTLVNVQGPDLVVLSCVTKTNWCSCIDSIGLLAWVMSNEG